MFYIIIITAVELGLILFFNYVNTCN